MAVIQLDRKRRAGKDLTDTTKNLQGRFFCVRDGLGFRYAWVVPAITVASWNDELPFSGFSGAGARDAAQLTALAHESDSSAARHGGHLARPAWSARRDLATS